MTATASSMRLAIIWLIGMLLIGPVLRSSAMVWSLLLAQTSAVASGPAPENVSRIVQTVPRWWLSGRDLRDGLTAERAGTVQQPTRTVGHRCAPQCLNGG